MTTEGFLEGLSLLSAPSDIILLVILIIHFLIGCWRGLTRTIFGLFGKLAAVILATFAARAVAPIMSNYLILPIVGSVFQQQASTAMQGEALTGFNGSSISQALQKLLDTNAVTQASEPLIEAAKQAAQHMADSLAYFLLFIIFLFACNMLIHMIADALHFFTEKTPLSALNALGGGIIGLATGAVICIAGLWILTLFAPAIFTELGVLSPSACQKTLLTRLALEFVSSLPTWTAAGI